MMARATLSIVSHGHGRLLASLLQDLSRQTVADELNVVVTLNIPEEAPAPEGYPGLELTVRRNSSPKGFGANHNAALRDASSPWVMVINPDIRIDDPHLIERLLGQYAESGTGLVAPLIRNSEGKREDSVRYNLDPLSLFGRRVLQREAIIEPGMPEGRFQWVAGMFMALPTPTWRALGGFDERFFLYCEDYDLCARLAVSGYPITIDSSLGAIHDAQRASRRSLKYLRWHLASLLRVWTSSHFWRIWAADLMPSHRHKLAGLPPANDTR